MNLSFKNSGRLVIIALIIVFSFSFSAAQDNNEALKKKYADILGDWKFNIKGMGEIIINLYIENGVLWSVPEFEDTPGELEPIEGNKLEFIVDAGDGSSWKLIYIKNENGKIFKCRLVNEIRGIDATGMKVIKEEKKTEKQDKSKIYSEISGNYDFEIEGMGIITVDFYVENGRIYAEAGSGPGELIPVEGTNYEFIIEDPDEGTYFLEFKKDETGKITMCKLINEFMGFDSVGKRKQK